MLGRARALSSSLALTLTTRLLIFLLRAVAQSGHNIHDICIYFSFSSPRYCHTQWTWCVGVYGYNIYIMYNAYATTRPSTTHDVSGPSLSAGVVSLARGLCLSPSILGSVRRRSSCRLTVYRPTDSRLYTCSRLSLCSSSSHHRTTTTRARCWETCIMCVHIYI